MKQEAEGDCLGIPYNTELASARGCSVCFWYGDTYDNHRLHAALIVICRHYDIVYAMASRGSPTGYWAHHDIER